MNEFPAEESDENETQGESTLPSPPPPQRSEKKGARKSRRSLLHVARRLLVLYLLICLGLFLLQRTIQYPRDTSIAVLPEDAARRSVQEIPLTTEDGLTLTAWYHPKTRTTGDARDALASSPPAPTIVFFPGNGGNREWRYEFVQLLCAQGASVLQVEYRGYGGNPGKPNEAALYRDAEVALAWVKAHSAGPIIAMGESLGTGVAIELASRHPLAGLIIHSGYTSTADVGGSMFWFLPVGLLLRDRFESIDKIGEITCPKLFLHGKDDRVIPVRFGEKLFLAAPEPKEWVAIAGAGHNDLWIEDLPRYFSTLREFIADVTAD